MTHDQNMTQNAHLETATLGGGCFWCQEAIYDELKGVDKVESGYAGGPDPNPSYQQVCSGTSGHAEVVQVTFNPTQLSFRDLLLVFFTSHDPTTLNRQGADAGTQYRSAIFYRNQAQKEVAEQVIAEISEAGLWSGAIVTELTPFEAFFIAEDYHQEYYRSNSQQPYCQVVIAPKLAKFRKDFAAKRK